MNFTHIVDYKLAVDRLVELGLPVREKGNQQPQAPMIPTTSRPPEDPAAIDSMSPLAPNPTPLSSVRNASHPRAAPTAVDAPRAQFTRDPQRGHTSNGQLESFTPADDSLRRTLFPNTSAVERPVTAPVPSDRLSELLPPQRTLPFVKPTLPLHRSQTTATDRVTPNITEDATLVPVSCLDAKISDRLMRYKTARNARNNCAASASGAMHQKPLYATASVQTQPTTSSVSCQTDSKTNAEAATKARASTATQPTQMPAEFISALGDYIHRHRSLEERAKLPHPPSGPIEGQQKLSPNMRLQRAAGEGPPPLPKLAMYAKSSPDDRRTALDSVIRDLIFDPNFEILCQDVEASWQKIGLEW